MVYPTLQANQSGLIDDLFRRMALRYGKHWLEMWAGIPMADVKLEWAENLILFHPLQIWRAIEHTGKFPPTLPEFADVCRQMPRPSQPMLTDASEYPTREEAKAIVANLRKQLERMAIQTEGA